MTRQKSWFPVLSIDRDAVEDALGFNPGLSDKHMEILAAALHDALRKKGFLQFLEDTLGELFDKLKKEIKKALEIAAPEKVTVNYGRKYCLECAHFDMSLGAPKACYGEVAYLDCKKGHWYLGPRDDYEKYYKERMCDARACPDFEPDPELAEIGKRVE